GNWRWRLAVRQLAGRSPGCVTSSSSELGPKLKGGTPRVQFLELTPADLGAASYEACYAGTNCLQYAFPRLVRPIVSHTCPEIHSHASICHVRRRTVSRL